ncbi:MAG TPA: hypothetical protein VFE62_00040 [Gemmataceae bacterium]|nr:hypothetical protein [Gemmataceae bacterium]
MALIHDSRPSDFGSGESEPMFERSKFAASATTETSGTASEVATYFGDKAEQATEAIGAGMESVGRSIREHAPDHGVLGTAGRAVGSKLEAGGHYLEDRGLTGAGDDLTLVIRQHPIPALFVGFGLGFLAMRLFRR